MEEAVVFEAAAAEERVEGVQRLLPLHRLGEGSVQIGGAQWRQLHQAGQLKEVFVSANRKERKKIREAEMIHHSWFLFFFFIYISLRHGRHCRPNSMCL